MMAYDVDRAAQIFKLLLAAKKGGPIMSLVWSAAVNESYHIFRWARAGL